jgi:hypothetical protein
MTNPSDPSEFRDIEEAASVLAGRIRRLRAALRSLSALGQEVAGLQEALAGITPDSSEDGTGDQPDEQRPSPADPPSTGSAGDPPAPGTHAMPVTNGAHSGSANGAALSVEKVIGPSSEEPSPSGKIEPNVAVTVSTQGGSVDLVRLYRALQQMPQIVEMNLTSYSGGRAVVGLTTPAQPRELPIEETLQGAFPEGIVGDWVGDAEFVAVIAAAG